MGWVLALLLIAVAAYFIIRTSAMALELTGLSRDAARFQAISAFFGVGFTTRESELVVNHAVRRRIIRNLIIIGNIGLLSIVASAIATITNSQGNQIGERFGLIVAVLAFLFALGRFQLINRAIDRVVRSMIAKSGAVRALDYDKLLGVSRGYSVSEIVVMPGSWLDGQTLAQCRLRDEGLNVLAVVTASGNFQGSPHGETRLVAGETIIVYGPDEALHRLATRSGGRRGLESHESAIDSFNESEHSVVAKTAPDRDPDSTRR